MFFLALVLFFPCQTSEGAEEFIGFINVLNSQDQDSYFKSSKVCKVTGHEMKKTLCEANIQMKKAQLFTYENLSVVLCWVDAKLQAVSVQSQPVMPLFAWHKLRPL